MRRCNQNSWMKSRRSYNSAVGKTTPAAERIVDRRTQINQRRFLKQTRQTTDSVREIATTLVVIRFFISDRRLGCKRGPAIRQLALTELGNDLNRPEPNCTTSLRRTRNVEELSLKLLCSASYSDASLPADNLDFVSLSFCTVSHVTHTVRLVEKHRYYMGNGCIIRSANSKIPNILHRKLLFNNTDTTQWKSSIITPVPKVDPPLTCSDYRPISITPILARLMENSQEVPLSHSYTS